MGTIYDGAFRTVLNDCRKLIIPVINEIFGETYTGEGDMMRGAMIETSAKRILNQGKSQGINETKKKTARKWSSLQGVKMCNNSIESGIFFSLKGSGELGNCARDVA